MSRSDPFPGQKEMGGQNNTASNIAATAFPSHQLSNGLYVSGHREQHKDRKPTMTSTAMPYTGGDIRKSGELGRMLDNSVQAKVRKAGNGSSSYNRTGSFGGGSSKSGPLQANGGSSKSGPLQPGGASKPYVALNRQNSASAYLTGSPKASQKQSYSGPITRDVDSLLRSSSKANFLRSLSTKGVAPGISRQNSTSHLPATGLITTVPSKKVFSGPLELMGGTTANNPVTSISLEASILNKSIPRAIIWTLIPLFLLAFVASGLVLATVKNAGLIIVVASIFTASVLLLTWNASSGDKYISEFLASYPDTDLKSVKEGEYVKISGVVTCGSVPLESSYQNVNRCVYTSTALYKYKGQILKQAIRCHLFSSWALHHLERYVADFYVSDVRSGLRALVKAGYGASVVPCVDEHVLLDVNLENEEAPADFASWLHERNLCCTGHVRLKEGYIKEGSVVVIMGMVQRHDDIVTIVPPREPISTGIQWRRLFLPRNLEALILKYDKACKVDQLPL